MSALRAAARIAGTSIAMGREYGERVINQRMEDTARVLSELCHKLETANGVQFVEILSSPRCGYHRRWPHRRVDGRFTLASVARIEIVLGGGSQYRGLLRRTCRPRRSVVADFRCLDDRKILCGWSFLQVPWLAGMVGLFAFEFIEGNTITRLYFMRLRRLTRSALNAGEMSPELQRARGELVPTFTHFLDLPLLFLIIALGAIQPTTWMLFFAGSIAAIVLATLLTILVPRLYPWGLEVLPA